MHTVSNYSTTKRGLGKGEIIESGDKGEYNIEKTAEATKTEQEEPHV